MQRATLVRVRSSCDVNVVFAAPRSVVSVFSLPTAVARHTSTNYPMGTNEHLYSTYGSSLTIEVSLTIDEYTTFAYVHRSVQSVFESKCTKHAET
jgi:hypothetical protein